MSKYEPNKHYILAIETSVSGGSLSLSQKDKEIDAWEGSGDVSKAEDVLAAISGLLTKNKIEKSQIGHIVASRGPGSFTGTRIGLAICLGLYKSIGCRISGVSVLDALAHQYEMNSQFYAAIPVGKKQVCLQKFEIGNKQRLIKLTTPRLMLTESFTRYLNNESETSFILHKTLYKLAFEHKKDEFVFNKRISPSKGNLAYLLKRFVTEVGASDNVQPLYVQNI